MNAIISNMNVIRDFDQVCAEVFLGGFDGSAGSLALGDEPEDFNMSFSNATNLRTVERTVAQSQPTAQAGMHPSMISMDNVTSISHAAPAPTKSSSATPYASLKTLVQNTQQQQQFVKRPAENISVASIFEMNAQSEVRPVSSLRAFLASKESEPSPKRRKVVDPSRLHRACAGKDLSDDLVQEILRDDPEAASRQVVINTKKSIYDCLTGTFSTRKVPESYTFPLNMAIQNQRSMCVIEQLINADKSVLNQKDGAQQEGSLHVLLKYQESSVSAVDAILLANHKSVRLEDRHFNTPLHVACRSGVSLDIIRHLCILYPEAITKRNFHGQTPLDLARSNIYMSSDRIANFLLRKVQASTYDML